jgi:hypothetical protein
MKQSSTDNFTKLSNQLLKSNKFTGDEKILLSWVIGWQESGKDCIASNKYIANELGLKIRTLQNIITKLNKYSFFTSNKQTRQNQYDAWVNSKIMYVNVEELYNYISTEKKVCNTAPIQPEVITDKIKDFIPQVVECITPTEIKELTPLEITTEQIEEYLIENTKDMNDSNFTYCAEMLKYYIPGWKKDLKDWKYITNFINNIILQVK